MTARKLEAGQDFPAITVAKLGGGELELSKAEGGHDRRLIVVYRGRHCPVCTKYLKRIDERLTDLNALGIDVVAVSADPQEKAEVQIAEVGPGFKVGYGLTPAQMTQLGLYVSHPRSAAETDRPFAEPGLFVVNSDGKLQIVDISNAPFARPDLESLMMGLKFIRNPENNYPIRGTHAQ